MTQSSDEEVILNNKEHYQLRNNINIGSWGGGGKSCVNFYL